MIYPGGRGDWTTPVLINEDGRMTALYGMFGGNNTMLRESNRQNTIVVPRPKDQDRCFFMSTEERK